MNDIPKHVLHVESLISNLLEGSLDYYNSLFPNSTSEERRQFIEDLSKACFRQGFVSAIATSTFTERSLSKEEHAKRVIAFGESTYKALMDVFIPEWYGQNRN